MKKAGSLSGVRVWYKRIILLRVDKKNTTILVKKDDGTSVRMTVAEFSAYKKSRAAAPLPAISEEKELATTTPTKDYFVDRALAENFRSPLEEQVDIPQKEDLPPLPASYDEHISTIANKLTFTVPSDLQGRFRSVLTLRLKRLRTDDEVESTVLENPLRGGLGLTPEQAEELRHVIDAAAPELPPLKMKPRPTPIRPSMSAPPVRSRPLSVKAPLPLPSTSPHTLPRVPMNREVHTTIQDIVPERTPKKTMSPIDELRLFTLQHFRHLSANPKEAADSILHKLTVLQQESYLLYIDGLSAFLTSPFYRQYQTRIQQSLNTGQTVQTICSEPSLEPSLSYDEFMAVADMRGKMV